LIEIKSSEKYKKAGRDFVTLFGAAKMKVQKAKYTTKVYHKANLDETGGQDYASD
jgi:hypothetical protein